MTKTANITWSPGHPHGKKILAVFPLIKQRSWRVCGDTHCLMCSATATLCYVFLQRHHVPINRCMHA